MSEAKIWFIYVTDHHEGPFDLKELQAKVASGILQKNTLAWKDGMAEWQAAESIKEMSGVFSAAPAAAAAKPAAKPAAPAPTAEKEEGSLALMLAQTQQATASGGDAAEAANSEPSLDLQVADAPDESADSLALSLAQSQSAAPEAQPADAPALSVDSVDPAPGADLVVESDTPPASPAPAAAAPAAAPITSSAPAAAPLSAGAADIAPDETDSVWTLQSSSGISGPYSYMQIKRMAETGDLAADFSLWRKGWTDFKAGKEFGDLVGLLASASPASAGAATATPAAALQPLNRAAVATGGSLADIAKRSSGKTRTNILAAMPEAALADLRADTANMKPWQKLIHWFKSKLPKKKSIGAPMPAAAQGDRKAKLKKFALPGGIIIVALLGAFIFMRLSSPLPKLEDVQPEDYEKMLTAAKQSLKQGAALVAIQSQEDPITPKIYLASNLSVGTIVGMELQGISGTLVNAIDFQRKLTAPVERTRLAIFGPLSFEGKPVPMGEYKLIFTAEGGVRQEFAMFIGGPKGPIYERRLKQYQEKLQAMYDPEVQELREIVNTVKNLRDDFEKKWTDVEKIPASASTAATKLNYWKAYGATLQSLLNQLDQKIKDRIAAAASGQERFYPDLYQQILQLVSTLGQMYQVQADHLEKGSQGLAPGASAAVVPQIQALEQSVAQAVVRSPLDALVLRAQKNSSAGGTASTPAATAAPAPANGAAPVATPATTTPAPAANTP